MTSSPPNTHPLTLFIERVVQTPQPGGYALINITLNAPITLSLAQQFGAFYWPDNLRPSELRQSENVVAVDFADTADNALYLFAYSPLNLQLLSPCSLSHAALERLNHSHITLHNVPETVGQSVLLAPNPQQPLLILASDTRIANALYLAKTRQTAPATTLVLLGAHEAFPFLVKPARFMVSNMPHEAIGACGLLEDWGIANRLASETGQAGCYEGRLSDLLEEWLNHELHSQDKSPSQDTRWQVAHFRATFIEADAQHAIDTLCTKRL